MSFADAFDLYAHNTDGKEKIALAVLALAAALERPVLIDLGAGNGRLAKLLSGAFARIIAVEKNQDFEPALASIPNVTPVIRPMEDFVPTQAFDIALMAYSLSGIPKDKLAAFLTGLENKKKEAGKILFVTYEDGCAWDCFAGTVYHALGMPKSGGENRHSAELEAIGREAIRVQRLDTLIWGENLAALYHNLGFFFFRKHSEYLQAAPQFMPLLESLVTKTDTGRPALPVSEALLEIGG